MWRGSIAQARVQGGGVEPGTREGQLTLVKQSSAMAQLAAEALRPFTNDGQERGAGCSACSVERVGAEVRQALRWRWWAGAAVGTWQSQFMP